MSSRNVCFTLNNWSEEEFNKLCGVKCTYIVIGQEIGEEGTPHLQGYIEWGRSVRWTTMHNIIKRDDKGAVHWENREASAKDASDYCKKGEQSKKEWLEHKTFGPNFGKNAKIFECGKISAQGERTDLKKLAEEVENGKSVDDIVLENPHAYHIYGRTLEKIENIVLRKKFRTVEPKCIWYYGKTGCGKSSIWRKNFDPENHYLWRNDNGWWDGYCGQKVIIIDEFRGQIPYSELLSITGGTPHFLRRRGKEPVPCLAEEVIITSVLKPEECYHNLAENDTLDQLYRRFSVAEVARG